MFTGCRSLLPLPLSESVVVTRCRSLVMVLLMSKSVIVKLLDVGVCQCCLMQKSVTKCGSL